MKNSQVTNAGIGGCICRIYEEFEKSLKEKNLPEGIGKLSYKGTQHPDYTKPAVQLDYFIKYAYAYTFEYKELYKRFFSRTALSDELKVTSVGCGGMLDRRGLAEALSEIGRTCNVEYEGVDIVDWKYRAYGNTDGTKYTVADAAEYFRKSDALDSDLYVFPRSISEIPKETFKELCRVFEKKEIRKNQISLMISHRFNCETKTLYGGDAEKCRLLKKAIENNGFRLRNNPESYEKFEKEDKIYRIQKDWRYPWAAYEKWKNLQKQAGNQTPQSPMLSTKYMCSQIMMFDRA